MKLKPCRVCKEPVAAKAEVCPHCGIKSPGVVKDWISYLADFTGYFLLLIGAIIGMLFVGYLFLSCGALALFAL